MNRRRKSGRGTAVEKQIGLYKSEIRAKSGDEVIIKPLLKTSENAVNYGEESFPVDTLIPSFGCGPKKPSSTRGFLQGPQEETLEKHQDTKGLNHQILTSEFSVALTLKRKGEQSRGRRVKAISQFKRCTKFKVGTGSGNRARCEKAKRTSGVHHCSGGTRRFSKRKTNR